MAKPTVIEIAVARGSLEMFGKPLGTSIVGTVCASIDEFGEGACGLIGMAAANSDPSCKLDLPIAPKSPGDCGVS